jgi:hypothetical protein
MIPECHPDLDIDCRFGIGGLGDSSIGLTCGYISAEIPACFYTTRHTHLPNFLGAATLSCTVAVQISANIVGPYGLSPSLRTQRFMDFTSPWKSCHQNGFASHVALFNTAGSMATGRIRPFIKHQKLAGIRRPSAARIDSPENPPCPSAWMKDFPARRASQRG